MLRKNLFLYGFLMISWFTRAQMPEVFSTADGAIAGYDPVAFFRESKPVMGKKELAVIWNNATWYFSTSENRDVFNTAPEKYAPQYGGWCAYGTADGHKSPTLPETWTVVDDKLYFNYNMNVKKKWSGSQKEYIEKADKNWPKLRKE